MHQICCTPTYILTWLMPVKPYMLLLIYILEKDKRDSSTSRIFFKTVRLLHCTLVSEKMGTTAPLRNYFQEKMGMTAPLRSHFQEKMGMTAPLRSYFQKYHERDNSITIDFRK